LIAALRAAEQKSFSLGRGGKKKGCGENEFPPRPRFFAAAIFRISLCEMRRQEVLPLSRPPIRGQRAHSLYYHNLFWVIPQ